MIVLDEQLLGHHIEIEIAKWYRGTVQFIIDLRPNSIIKDEAIPDLLRKYNHPTFITINERDFWRKVDIDIRFCVVCFTLPDYRVKEISGSLKILFRQADFKTKRSRMGKVIRISDREVSFYSHRNKEVKTISIV